MISGEPAVAGAMHSSAAGADLPVSLVEHLHERSQAAGSSPAYVFLDGALEPQRVVTYSALQAGAAAVADALVRSLHHGDRVLLAFDHGPEAVQLFWGCLVAGMVPVPAPAPDAHATPTSTARLRGMATDSGAVLALCPQDRLDAGSRQVPDLAWRSLETLLLGSAASRPPVRPAQDPAFAIPADMAYLQYTSGSTREPRGVVITHRNLLAHGRAIDRLLHTADARSLTWLPWFHDYGLIHGVIQPVLSGVPSYLLPTAQFLLRPLKWLEAIERHAITHSGAPDFAYAACVRALTRSPRWRGRLDTWRVASCGAEPVRAETLAAFAEAFAPSGFSAAAWAPSYGLAEAVLAVSVHHDRSALRLAHLDAQALGQHQILPRPPGMAGTRTVVGCGHVVSGLEVQIVDPTTHRPCASDRVGEIWVAGPSVAHGYWRQPESTREHFEARLLDDGAGHPAGPYLRTGDLGFVQDGELFITGRIKDLIVVHGRNLYPSDLEHTAEQAHLGVRAGGAVAIPVEAGGREAAVLLVECSRRPGPDAVRALLDAVQQRVAADHHLELREIVPLRPGSLPRTSSGKPRRSLARQLYQQGALEPLRLPTAGRAPEPTPTDSVSPDAHGVLVDELSALWAEVLGCEAPDPHANFFDLGGDSLLATQLVSRLRARRGVDLPISALFEAPTLDALARRVAAAPASVCPDSTAPANPADTAAPRAPGTRVALSFSQERMAFMHQLAPDNPAYNVPLALELRGDVNVPALQAALTHVVDRHEVLRTRFLQTPEGMVGEVVAAEPPHLQVVTLDIQEPDPQHTALARHLVSVTHRPFRLAQPPLWRAELVRLGERRSVLLLVMHHVISDQWSFAELGRELAAHYNAFRATGEATHPALPGLPMQYADYAAWHRHWFDDQRRALELAYWSHQLEGLLPLPLNTDFPRPLQPASRGASLRFALPPPLVDTLRHRGAEQGASLSMVMISALKALLFRHTGHTDIAIGVPIANRHHLSAENLIGTFVNLLVFRTRLDGDLDFRTLLARVRAVSLDAFAHQDMPFELLVRELASRPDASRQPLFNVMFNMVNTQVRGVRFDGLEWSRWSFDRRSTQFDLAVVVDTLYDSAFVIEYDADLFVPATIQRMGEHLLHILQAVADQPHCTVSALPLLGNEEQQQLAQWSLGPQLALPPFTVAEWVQQGLQPDPQHTALVCGQQRLSHQTLHQRSNQLARWLRAQGIARGQRVGLFLPRSPELVIGLLAVLKAGAAYVPLDPEYPAERLAHQMADADLALLLTTAALAPAIAAGGPPQQWLDPAEAPWSALPSDALAADPGQDAGPLDPAYLIYTSGSTGRPKGVVVPHRAVVNFLLSMAREPGLQAGDRLLAVTTPSFDIAVLELLLPLGLGATVVVASEAQVKDGQALVACIAREAITVLQATPSRWHLLLAAGWSGTPGLKALVGGEPLTPALASALLQRCGAVWNLYGPTETTVWSSAWRVTADAVQRISLGLPIANTSLQVLDDRGQPCPIGVPGEICIGGMGVALGYFRQEGLTAERFVDLPLAPREEDRRLYRTGDRGRWRHDGTLEHGGRLDDQVKLRGVRLELGEVEAHLNAHPAVARAVVVLRADAAGQDRLVAYCVARGSLPTPEALRQHLRRWLPDSLLPSAFVSLESIPTLPNGKTDRRALPAPATCAGLAAGPLVGPRTATERVLWELWRSALKQDSFGVHDNFFDLGGHSLQAVSVVHRIETELHRACGLALLFEHPTVAGLSAALDAQARATGQQRDEPVALLQAEGSDPALFLLAGAEMYRALAHRLASVVPVYGLFSQTEIDLLETGAVPAPESVSLQTLANEYVALIRRVQPHGPYRLGGFSVGGVLAFEVAQRLQAAGEKIDLVLLLDTMLPGRGLARLWAGVRRRLRLLRRDGWRHLAHLLRVLQHQAAHRHEPGSRRIGVYARAIRQYRPTPCDLPVLFVQADGDGSPVPAYGWQRLVPNLQLERVPGQHMDLLEPPQVDVLASHVRNRMALAQSAA